MSSAAGCRRGFEDRTIGALDLAGKAMALFAGIAEARDSTMNDTPQTGGRGGARRGAGRKPVLTSTQRLALGALIDDMLWRETHALSNRALEARLAEDDLPKLWAAFIECGMPILMSARGSWQTSKRQSRRESYRVSASCRDRQESHPAFAGRSFSVWLMPPRSSGIWRCQCAWPNVALRNIELLNPGVMPI